VCRQNVLNSTATLTALVSRIGYARAQALAGAMQESGKSLKTLVLGQNLLSESEFEQLISAESVTRLGEKESAHD
jgi:aspartate ammonia-lyase